MNRGREVHSNILFVKLTKANGTSVPFSRRHAIPGTVEFVYCGGSL